MEAAPVGAGQPVSSKVSDRRTAPYFAVSGVWAARGEALRVRAGFKPAPTGLR